MKKLMFAAVAAVGMVFGAKAETQEYLWTGAAGDGNLWATPGNWALTNGTAVTTAPTKDDNVYFLFTTKGQTLTVEVDADDAEINKLRVLGGTLTLGASQTPQLGTLNITGKKLRFYGNGGYSTGNNNNVSANTIYSSQTLNFANELLFQYGGSGAGITIGLELLNTTFAKPVLFRGNTISIHAAFSYSAKKYGTVTFNDTVTAQAFSGTTTIGDAGYPDGTVVFNGKVTADVFGAASISGSSATFKLNATGNDIGTYCTSHAAINYLGAENALAEKTVLTNLYNSATGTSLFNLGKYDQVADGLTSFSETRCTPDKTIYNVLSDSAVTLTLKGSTDYETGMRISGLVSIVWDSADKHTQTFRNRTHTTTGSLTVKSGTIALTEATTFSNVTNLTIDADGAIDITANTVMEPFPAMNLISATTGGKLKMVAEQTITTKYALYNGSRVKPGTYSQTASAGVKAAAWIEGAGQVIVTDAIPVETTWTGATGDGKWSTPGNWTNDNDPYFDADVVTFELTDNVSVEVDVEGIKMRRLRVLGSTVNAYTLTLTGKKITITGEQNDYNTSGTTVRKIAPFVADQIVYFKLPVDFVPYGGGSSFVYGYDVQFSYPVNFVGYSFCVKAGYYFGGPSVVSRTGNIYFYDTVTTTPSAGKDISRIGDGGDPSGTVYFKGKVTTDYFGPGYIASSSGAFYLSAANNDIGVLKSGWAGVLGTLEEGVLSERTVLTSAFSLPGYYKTSQYVPLDLYGYCQTMNRLSGYDARLGTDSRTYAIKSTINAGAVKASRPPTLTLKGTADDTSSVVIEDNVSLVWDPTGDYTQTLANRKHTTSGTLTVKRGTLKLTGTTSFENVPRVTIAAGSVLDCSENTVNPFPGATIFEIEGEGDNAGKIVAANGVAFTAGQVIYKGAVLAKATYSSAEWLSGGEVEVTDTSVSTYSYWKGGSGNWEDAANWMGGNVPTVGTTKFIVFTKPQSAKVTVTLNGTYEDRFFDITVGNNYQLKVAEGATFSYMNWTGSSYNDQDGHNFDILEGGEWLNEGTTKFKYFVGEARIAGKFTNNGGTFSYAFLSTNPANRKYNPIRVLPTGEFYATGGSVTAYSGSSDVLTNEGGKVEFNGYQNMDFTTARGARLPIQGCGTTVFSGAATLKPNSLITFASDVGKVATVNFEDTAADNNQDSMLVFGDVVGSVTLVNWNSTSGSSTGAETYIGAEEGVVTNIIAAGKTLKGSIRGVRVGSPTRGVAANSQSGVYGYVLCNGALNSSGSTEEGWKNDYAPNGILVGYGMGIYAETTVTENKYFGQIDIPTGGSISSGASSSVIGAGYGEGEINVNGGTANLSASTYNFSSKVFSHPATIIGLAGGKGKVNVSAGAFNCNKGTLFVGGATTNDVPVMERTGDGVIRPWRPTAGYLIDRHDAEGEIVHTGGAISLSEGCVIGADGTGKLTLIGDDSEGTFTVNYSANYDFGLVLSNSTAVAASAKKSDAATIKWVANEKGIRKITAINRPVVISDGAKFEIDLSAVPKADLKGRYCLISAPAVEGMANLTMDKVTLTLPEGVEAPRAIVDNIPGKGIYLRLRLGFVLMFK